MRNFQRATLHNELLAIQEFKLEDLSAIVTSHGNDLPQVHDDLEWRLKYIV